MASRRTRLAWCRNPGRQRAIFSVNGMEVKRMPKASLHVDGLIGFRIGHNLDIDVDQVSK